MVLPPRRVVRLHTLISGQQPDRSVDQLPNDVGMSGMSLGFYREVGQYPMQRDLVVPGGPVRHLSGGVEGQGTRRRSWRRNGPKPAGRGR